MEGVVMGYMASRDNGSLRAVTGVHKDKGGGGNCDRHDCKWSSKGGRTGRRVNVIRRGWWISMRHGVEAIPIIPK